MRKPRACRQRFLWDRAEPRDVGTRIPDCAIGSFFGKPNGPLSATPSTSPNHPDIYIRQFVRIANWLCAPRTGNFRNGRANYFCVRMKRRHFCVDLGAAFDIVCRAAGFFQMSFERALRFVSALRKAGICGCSIRSGGRLARMPERICSRLLLDILFLPVGDIPLTKALLRDLRQFPIPPPGIERPVV